MNYKFQFKYFHALNCNILLFSVQRCKIRSKDNLKAFNGSVYHVRLDSAVVDQIPDPASLQISFRQAFMLSITTNEKRQKQLKRHNASCPSQAT